MNPTGDPLGPSGRVFPVEAALTPLCPMHGTCTSWPPQRGSRRRSPKLIDPKGLHEVFWSPRSCVSAPWHPQVTSPCAWEPPDISLKPSRRPPEAPFARCAQAGSEVNPKELFWGERGSILPALGFALFPGGASPAPCSPDWFSRGRAIWGGRRALKGSKRGSDGRQPPGGEKKAEKVVLGFGGGLGRPGSPAGLCLLVAVKGIPEGRVPAAASQGRRIWGRAVRGGCSRDGAEPCGDPQH